MHKAKLKESYLCSYFLADSWLIEWFHYANIWNFSCLPLADPKCMSLFRDLHTFSPWISARLFRPIAMRPLGLLAPSTTCLWNNDAYYLITTLLFTQLNFYNNTWIEQFEILFSLHFLHIALAQRRTNRVLEWI
jgi:hypothetical protein